MTAVQFGPQRLARAFSAWTGHSPDGMWRAPGRVNLIGEHLDYNGGHVLPFAIGLSAHVAVRRTGNGVLRCRSVQLAEECEVALDRLSRSTRWMAYPAGVVWAMAALGVEPVGIDLLIDSEVPLGAGLSSSAAIECAIALALADLAGMDTSTAATRRRLAGVAQQAESQVAGAPVGIMDQMTSLMGRAGHALFMDTRQLGIEAVRVGIGPAGLHFLAVDTGTPHSHSGNDYAARRRACEEAAARLGLRYLTDAGPDVLTEARLPASLLGPTRHVVSEEARTLRAADALRDGRFEELGRLMTESHRSMQHDFANTTPALDALVDAVLQRGALGARMTGGGWGGAAVLLVPGDRVGAVSDAVAAVLAAFGAPGNDLMTLTPSSGAERLA